MRSLHVLEPYQSISQTLQTLHQLCLDILPIPLRKVVPDLYAVLHIKKQVALAEVSAVTFLMLEEVLFQPGHVIILIGYFFIDEFLDPLVFQLVIGGDDAKDVLIVGGAIVKKLEVAGGRVKGVLEDGEPGLQLLQDGEGRLGLRGELLSHI